MRDFLMATVAATTLLGGSLARAADLPQKMPPAAAPAVVTEQPFSWSGVYAGGNIGAGWSNPTLTYSPTGTVWGLNQLGFVGGGQLGFNYQIGHAVLGVEGDADWTSLNNKSGLAGGQQTRLGTPFVTTAAGRIGAAFGNWMLFAKGGGGWVDNTATLYNAAGGTLWTGSHASPGWLAGGGLEYAFGRNWSVKAEYDFIGLANWTATPGVVPGDGLKVSREFQAAKLGFNYRF